MKPGPSSSNRDLAEGFFDFLNGAARLLLILGAVVSLGALALCIYLTVVFQNPGDRSVAQALTNIGIAKNVLSISLLATGIAAAYLFWGEELLSALLVIFAGLVYFAPLYVPMAAGSGGNPDVNAAAYNAIQGAGMLFGIFALGVLVIDLGLRVKDRAKQGTKLENLRYGKGIKEEPDRQNVFMGKCWQLPFCRKFVREKCPIYHSKRTCWRERVGCMCEEEVIRNAMEGRPIPKDALLAANYIPQNNKLTFEQKKERCRQCVIYNEHQKHKYKLALPMILLTFIGGYALLRTPLLAVTGAVVDSFNRIFGMATMRDASQFAVPRAFQEVLLICVMIVLLAYALKLLEFLIFKLKV